jgi:putative flippase GtrA
MEGVARSFTTQRAPERHGPQLVRYLVVGGCGYVLGMAIYAAQVAVGVSAYAAVIPAFVLNGAFNFVLNRRWSFPASGRPVHSELLRFCVVAAATLLANFVVLRLLHGGIGLAPVPAQALTVVLVTPVGFLGNRQWSFRGD